MIYVDDEDELAWFTFSPFIVRNESDDEALVTKGQLKAINEKLDTLLQASKLSSSDKYSQASIKSILETLTKEHSSNLEKMNNAVNASTSICKETNEKADKLISDATMFMNNFQSSCETNKTRANEAIANLGSSLKERTKLQEVGTGIITDHEEFKSSISSQISKLQDDLAMESKIMDSPAIKTKKVKVLTVKLEHAEKQIQDLIAEKAIMKSCISDVNGLLSDNIKTRDPMITITILKHLVEKLRPMFAMLHRLEGIPEPSVIPKQRGD